MMLRLFSSLHNDLFRVGCSRIWESSYFPAGTPSARGRQGSRSNKTFVVYSKQFTTHRNINRVEDIPNSPLQASSSCCRVSSRTSGWTSAPSRWGCRPRRSATPGPVEQTCERCLTRPWRFSLHIPHSEAASMASFRLSQVVPPKNWNSCCGFH